MQRLIIETRHLNQRVQNPSVKNCITFHSSPPHNFFILEGSEGSMNINSKNQEDDKYTKTISNPKICAYLNRHRERQVLILFIEKGNKLALLTRDFWLTRSSSAVINSSVMQLTVGIFFKVFFIACMLERAPLISL